MPELIEATDKATERLILRLVIHGLVALQRRIGIGPSLPRDGLGFIGRDGGVAP